MILVEEIREPVCNARVRVRRETRRFHLNGLDYYFCSAECIKKFIGEPLSYVFEPEECKNEIEMIEKKGY